MHTIMGDTAGLPAGHDWLHITTSDGREYLLARCADALARAQASIASTSRASSSAALFLASSAWVYLWVVAT